MDGANASQRLPQPPPQQQTNLIRFEQVRKLPHLNADQKQRYEQIVQKLWNELTSNPQGSDAYTSAYQRLAQLSTSLMTAMKSFQTQRKQQQQQQQQMQAQQQQQQQGQQPQQPQPTPTTQLPVQGGGGQAGLGTSNTVLFSQLNPAIQNKVNELTFYFPPAMIEGTKPAEDWLREAKARYGQALQRSEIAQTKKREFHRQATQRAQNGNPLNEQELIVFNNKVQQCNKAITDSTSFMKKFEEQQQTFRAQQPQHRFAATAVTGESNESNAASTTLGANQSAPGPTAHSISSAVSAARSQAVAAQAAMTSPPTAQAQLSQTGTPVQQFSHATQPSPFTAHHPQNLGQPDPQRPVSQHMPATMQSGHPYNPQHPPPPPSATHAHPPNFLAAGTNPAAKDRPQVSKNLQVPEPKPVPMPPSRPTLTGGPGLGMPGQMGQPAISSMPGYALESSEDGRLLSKKKLHEVIREVCGPGAEDQLTPEAEELFLQVVDDFVDDVITRACHLAKVRGATTLEVKDIQVVLERDFNIRIPGFSTDEVRTVRRSQPAPGWAHKMSAVQAAKLTGGGVHGAGKE